MGRIKLEQIKRIENDQENGLLIKEAGEQTLEDALSSSAALERIEAVDDDDKDALEAAVRQADGIAKSIARAEIREPGGEVVDSLAEIGERSAEYSRTEKADAQTAERMSGDYSTVGMELSASLMESGREFLDISEQGEKLSAELRAEYNAIASQLEGVF